MVGEADVFEHLDLADGVILADDVPVVLELQGDLVGQALAFDLGAAVVELGLGQGDAVDGDAVVPGRPARQAGPAAADVEQLLARLEAQLAADPVQLLFLGGFQRRVVVGEIGAGVDHLRIQEDGVEVVADIIVELDEVLVAAARLVGADAVVAGLVPFGQLGRASVRAVEQEGQGGPGDQSLVGPLGQVDGAAVVPAVGGVQRRSALDPHVAGGEHLEQGHQAGLEHQPAHGAGPGDHDLDVVASVRTQRQDLAVPQAQGQVGLKQVGDMGRDAARGDQSLVGIGGHA